MKLGADSNESAARRHYLALFAVLLLLAAASCQAPVVTPTSTRALPPTPLPTPTVPTATPTPTPRSAPTQTRVSELPKVTSAFTIDGKPFRFLGSLAVGPWFLEGVPWQQDLILTAKQSGIRVLHVPIPPFEEHLGVYQEKGLRQLDQFLDLASRNGVYITIEVMQGIPITRDQKNPYYHPGGMEGLVRDTLLKEAYKKQLAHLIMHRNTVNGTVYRDDPTILDWLLIHEPVVAPFNYPAGHPGFTASELRDWIQEMALYAKSLDANHLVSVGTGAPIDSLDNWLVALDVPALDYIYVEDADARILQLIKGHGPDPYPLELFALGKPVVVMLSFTSGAWDLQRIGTDYVWQARTLREEAEKYFEAGASGVVIFSWGSALAKDAYSTYLSKNDLLFTYDVTNRPIVEVLKELQLSFTR